MNDLTIGIIAGFSFFLLLGAASQVSNNYKSEQDIANEFSNVYLTMQPKNWRVQSSTPVVRDLGGAEVILQQSTNSAVVPRIYTKLGNQTWFVKLSSQ